MISSLRKSTSKSIYALDMESKAARKALKKEVLFAVKSAAKKAKANLKKSVQWANGRFAALNTVLARNNRKSAAARARLNRQINREQRRASRAIRNAVASQNRALLALKSETNKKLKKANNKLTSHANQMARNARAVAAQMKSDVATLQSRLASADAASVRRYTAALGQINGALAKAKKDSNNRFGKLYTRMAKQRKALDTKLASSVRFLNDKTAERAALADVRFSKTVKKLGAVRAAATRAVNFARKQMNTKIVSLTSEIKASESRLKGEISIVSGEVMRDRQAQIRVNRRVNKEMSMIIHTANVRHSQSKRARGKLRAILNANKAAAAQEVAALAKKTRFACAMLRGKMARQRRSAAKALTSATQRLHKKINAATRAQQVVVAGQRAALRGAAAAAKSALKGAKSQFAAKLNTLANLVSSNNRKFENGLRRVTGVAHSWKKNSARARVLMRENTRTMNRDMTRAIARSVQIGEARAKAVEAQAMSNIKKTVAGLRTLASEKIEAMANKVFATVQQNRQKVADNYLSLKAYAGTAADKINDYVAKGKGRGLGSIGDLLKTVGTRVNVKVGKDEGIGAGAKKIPMIFSAKKITVKNPVTKIKWLVDEYIKLLNEVQQRWPIGLGKYLLSKVEGNMQTRGVLEVDRVAGKAGNFVFINAHSVGLSSKLSDFEGLAVRMTRYQSTLAKLTGKLTQKHAKTKKKVLVKPPEWEGN